MRRPRTKTTAIPISPAPPVAAFSRRARLDNDPSKNAGPAARRTAVTVRAGSAEFAGSAASDTLYGVQRRRARPRHSRLIETISARGPRPSKKSLILSSRSSGRAAIETDALVSIFARSLAVSLSATALASLIGTPLRAGIAVYEFPGRQLLVVAVNALLGLPPVVGCALTTAIVLETSKGDLSLALGLGFVLIGTSVAVSTTIFGRGMPGERWW